MNIRIQNFPPDITVEAVRDFLGDFEGIEDILLPITLRCSQTGATAIADYIDGRFYQERRLSAQALTLLND